MALNARLLASGSGWSVTDVICTAGPQDRPFEERHDDVCIAAVTGGTFHYRSSRGAALLMPGAVLLGNHCDAFECSHEHGSGDRCLSFHFTPEFAEGIAAGVPGMKRLVFTVPRLAPHAALLPLIAAAEAGRKDADPAGLEELAVGIAGAVCGALADSPRRVPAPSRRDERRIASILREIEAHSDEPLPLAALADKAAMSRYHFLRTFSAVVGMTPHQFILHTRLRRAAIRLRRSRDDVAAVAFDAGFNDLSTFNRRFRRILGRSPSAYRGGAN